MTEPVLSSSSLGVQDDMLGISITEAGSPVSAVFLFSWAAVSLLTYTIFVVFRPAAVRTISNDARRPNIENLRAWAIRQLFCVSWAWIAFDVIHRLMCYTLLDERMLWRREMLPLPPHLSWLNMLRAPAMCGLSAHRTSDSLECLHSVELPVSIISSSRSSVGDEWKTYPSDEQLSEAIVHYQRATMYALAVTLSVVLCIGRLYVWMRSVDEPVEQADMNGTAHIVKPVVTNAVFPKEHNLSQTDDAWLDSPEALAEEARWEAEKDGNYASPFINKKHRRSNMSVITGECWPTALGCVYASMYAVVGGMPLLMYMLLPVLVVVSSLAAMALPS